MSPLYSFYSAVLVNLKLDNYKLTKLLLPHKIISNYLCIAAHLNIRTGDNGQRTIVVSVRGNLKSNKIV